MVTLQFACHTDGKTSTWTSPFQPLGENTLEANGFRGACITYVTPFVEQPGTHITQTLRWSVYVLGLEDSLFPRLARAR
jgi:hypothetical protein